MSRYWSDIVHRLTPYVPGEQPALAHPVKLNTNENPYPPSPAVVSAIRDSGHSLTRSAANCGASGRSEATRSWSSDIFA